MTQEYIKYRLRTKDPVLCILSAGLLILAFPKTDWWICAWGGLVPLMFVLDGKRPLEAFRSAYLCGLVFFTGTLFWFFHLTKWFSTIAALGVTLLFLYLALYFGIFGLSYSLFSRRKPLFKLFLLPSIWVVLEFIRAHLFTGFDWASLGQSQYKNLPVIQIADVTGMFGVSFLVVMVNALLKEFITAAFIRKTPEAQKTLAALMWTTAVIVTVVLGYGVRRLSDHPAAARFPVAVIQANIPQEMKWHKPDWPVMVEEHIALSEQAAQHSPKLIIWPETSYPGHLWDERELFIQLEELVRKINIPLLFGSVVKEGDDYYNTAIMLSRKGDIVEIYRKIHLVPFGEFLPLRSLLPFLSDLVGIGDFTAGNKKTVFPFPAEKNRDQNSGLFSVLICFEDTVARLSRRFVREGAQLLVNITNDAWFGNTKAPFMHLQSSVFRAVENRRGLVRAANTGVSCFIDRKGRISNYVESGIGSKIKRAYIGGYAVGQVDFSGKETFYTKFGDVFTILCFGCILMGIIRKQSAV